MRSITLPTPTRKALAHATGDRVAVPPQASYCPGMKMVLARMLRSRIFRGVGANSYIQVVQTVAQFCSVAIVASHWGLKTYGLWILLFTVPSYLTMSDFGLASAATAKMTGLVAQGRRAEAVAIYQGVRATALVMSMVALLVGIVLVYGPLHPRLIAYDPATGGSLPLILVMLGLYGAITLQNGVTAGAFSATGGYATIGYMVGTMFALETAGLCLIVLAGGTIFHVTCCYLAIRTAGTIAIGIALQRSAPWIATLRWQSSFSVVKKLFRPAAALMALTGAQALSIQGTVAVIGFVVGPLAVPAFTTVRTMSRMSAQGILIVNHAMMPSFSAASATANRTQMSRLAVISVAISLVFSTGLAIGMLLFGQWFIRLWTGNVVHPGFALVAVMALVMFFNTTWQPISNLILSINRHERFSYHYVGAAVVTFLLCLPLVKVLGPTGAAVSALMLEISMTFWVGRIAIDLGIIDLKALPRQLVHLPRSLGKWGSGVE